MMRSVEKKPVTPKMSPVSKMFNQELKMPQSKFVILNSLKDSHCYGSSRKRFQWNRFEHASITLNPYLFPGVRIESVFPPFQNINTG